MKLLLDKKETESEISQLEAKLTVLKEKVDILDKTMKIYDPEYQSSKVVSPMSDLKVWVYPEGGTWKTKISYILQTSNKHLKAREVVKGLLMFPDNRESEDTLNKTVGQMLWSLKKDGFIDTDATGYFLTEKGIQTFNFQQKPANEVNL